MPTLAAVRTPPGATAAALILAAVVCIVGACRPLGLPGRRETPAAPTAAPDPAPAPQPDPAALRAAADTALRDHARSLGRMGLFCTLAAVAAFVAGFLPIVGPFVPVKAAGASAAAAGALWLAEYWMLAYGRLAASVALWLTLAAAAVAVIPYALTAWRWLIHRQGRALIAAGHIRDGVALAAAGNRTVNRHRRQLAATLGGPK